MNTTYISDLTWRYLKISLVGYAQNKGLCMKYYFASKVFE